MTNRHRSQRRIAVVVSHPIQYMCHTYKSLADQPGIDLRVVFGSMMGVREYFDAAMGTSLRWNADLLSGFDWRCTESIRSSPRLGQAFGDRISGTWDCLTEFQPDAVLLHGYARVECLTSLLWAALHRRRVVLFGDGNGRIEISRPIARRLIKRLCLGPVLACVSRVLSLGEANRRYWELLGVPARRVVYAPLYIPSPEHFFLPVVERLTRREQARRELGIAPGAFVAMYCGKFEARKRVCDLVEAIDRCDSMIGLYVGDGEQRAACESQTRDPRRHFFLRFVNLERLADLYAAADVLVHPARDEPYGMVIAEAAMMGLPVIATGSTGALGIGSHGRIGENAYSFADGDAESLARLLKSLAESPAERERMGRRSIEISQEMRRASMSGLLFALGARFPDACSACGTHQNLAPEPIEG